MSDESEGTRVVVDPEQPLELDVSVGEYPHLPVAYRWMSTGVLPIEGRPVWIDGKGSTRLEALQDLIRAGTDLRVAERRRRRAKEN